MVDFLLQNWVTLLGGGSITGVLGWFFYGRKNQDAEYTTKVRKIYDELSADIYKELDRVKKEHRDDILYFRDELGKRDAVVSTLQGQFNSINTAYVTEVESSKKWERLYNELLKEVVGLRNQVSDFDLQKAFTQEVSDSWEKKFNDLQKEHDQLKKAFENYKKKQ